MYFKFIYYKVKNTKSRNCFGLRKKGILKSAENFVNIKKFEKY